MYITDYRFTEYYQQYVTFEADDLTEKCRDQIDVNMDDCYALCSSWINEDGEIMFNVLAIGPDWKTCTKGLDEPEMLAEFALDDVRECEARIAIADFDMINKNGPFQKKMDENTEEELKELRMDERFDEIRDFQYPDIVEIWYLYKGQYQSYGMRMKEIRGPFVMGEITDLPEEESDVNYGEVTYTLPFIGPEGMGLMRVFGDDSLETDDEEKIQELINETTKDGISFDGIHIRS